MSSGGILGTVIHRLMEPDEPKPQQIEEYEFDDIVRQLQMHAPAKVLFPKTTTRNIKWNGWIAS